MKKLKKVQMQDIVFIDYSNEETVAHKKLSSDIFTSNDITDDNRAFIELLNESSLKQPLSSYFKHIQLSTSLYQNFDVLKDQFAEKGQVAGEVHEFVISCNQYPYSQKNGKKAIVAGTLNGIMAIDSNYILKPTNVYEGWWKDLAVGENEDGETLIVGKTYTQNYTSDETVHHIAYSYDGTYWEKSLDVGVAKSEDDLGYDGSSICYCNKWWIFIPSRPLKTETGMQSIICTKDPTSSQLNDSQDVDPMKWNVIEDAFFGFTEKSGMAAGVMSISDSKFIVVSENYQKRESKIAFFEAQNQEIKFLGCKSFDDDVIFYAINGKAIAHENGKTYVVYCGLDNKVVRLEMTDGDEAETLQAKIFSGNDYAFAKYPKGICSYKRKNGNINFLLTNWDQGSGNGPWISDDFGNTWVQLQTTKKDVINTLTSTNSGTETGFSVVDGKLFNFAGTTMLLEETDEWNVFDAKIVGNIPTDVI